MEVYEEININYKADSGIDIIELISDLFDEIRDTVLAYIDTVAMEEGLSSLSIKAPEHAAVIQGAMFLGAITFTNKMSSIGVEMALREIYDAARELSEGGMERAGLITLFSGIGAKVVNTVISKIGSNDRGWETAGFAVSVAGTYAALQLKRGIADRSGR